MIWIIEKWGLICYHFSMRFPGLAFIRALLFLMVTGPLGFSSMALATMANQVSLKQSYLNAKAISCKTCHQATSMALNLYGEALKKSKSTVNPKRLTVKEIQAVDLGDADADGATNGEEIKAATSPGDPASVPAAKAGKPSTSRGEPEPFSALVREWNTPFAWADEAQPDALSQKAEYVGSESCAVCHAGQWKEFQNSTHARIQVDHPQVKAQGCEMCHGPGSLHVAQGGGKGVGGIINPSQDPAACFTCHLDKKAEFRLPFHHPVLEGKMSCTACHEPHGAEVRPWSATTLADMNDACFKCHKEQRGPFAWEHEALREGCTTCHKVHGSIHDKMLIAADNNLCLRCHTQVNFPMIGKQAHGGRLPQGTCFSAGCHTAVHGSNFDDHLRY